MPSLHLSPILSIFSPPPTQRCCNSIRTVGFRGTTSHPSEELRHILHKSKIVRYGEREGSMSLTPNPFTRKQRVEVGRDLRVETWRYAVMLKSRSAMNVMVQVWHQGIVQHNKDVAYWTLLRQEGDTFSVRYDCSLINARLTLRLLMSYIYGAPILDVSRSHTTTHHSR